MSIALWHEISELKRRVDELERALAAAKAQPERKTLMLKEQPKRG